MNSKNILTVEYNAPTKRLPNENKSKLLKSGSELYNHITKLKTILKENGFNHQDRIDLHTEVLNDNNETEQIFLHRVSLLEKRKIDVKNKNNYKVIGRAIALMLGNLNGYKKDAHITIAFFPDKNPTDALKIVLENL